MHTLNFVECPNCKTKINIPNQLSPQINREIQNNINSKTELIKKTLTFTVEGTELKQAEDWIKQQKKKHGDQCGTVGDRFSYIFNPTGIGLAIIVKDAYSGEEKNVTDFSSW